MGRIDVNRDKHVTVWRYSDNRVYDLKSACDWLAKIIEIPSVEINHISLRELTNRNDEGNTSKQTSGCASSLEIYHIAQEIDADIISLTGKYKEKLIVIGVDVRDRLIYITLKNSSANLIDEIQDALGLD